MKASFLSFSTQKAFLCICMAVANGGSATGQNTSNTNFETKLFYYGFALAIIILVVATILVMQKARSILGEQGQPLFQPEYSIFKRMTKAKTTVALVMVLLVLWGMYLIITYRPG